MKPQPWAGSVPTKSTSVWPACCNFCQSRARQHPGEPVIESPSGITLTVRPGGGAVVGGLVGGVVVGGVAVGGVVVGGVVVGTLPVQATPLRANAAGAVLACVQLPLKPNEAVAPVAIAAL